MIKKASSCKCMAVRFVRIGFLYGIVLPVIVSCGLAAARHNHMYGMEMSMPGICEAAEAPDIFAVDVVKQKANIEKEFGKIEDWIPPAKLHEVRNSADLIEHKIDRMRKNLSNEDMAAYQSRIEKVRKIISVKEDSLVNLTLGLLHTKSVDAALQFMQNDLRVHGVSENKISAVERKILEEAPAIKQAQEREAIARTLEILKSGKLPDSSIDPYILKTAQLIIKAHEDSIKRIEDEKKRIEMEEREKIERARIEKEMKEKKEQEERLAKQKQEEEKQRIAEEQRQKKLLAQQEKARKDSIEAEKKIKQRKDELERESQRRIEEALKAREKALYAGKKRQKQTLAQMEKARKDSIEAEQKEKDRLTRIEEQRQKQTLTQMEKARKDSIEAEENERNHLARIEDLRQKLMLAQQEEKARKDSIEADRLDKERIAKAEDERQRKLLAEQAQKQAAYSPETKAPVVSSVQQNPSPRSLPEEQKQPPIFPKNAQKYLQKLKDNQKEAQKYVMELYKLLEQTRGNEALEKFKQRRGFISQYVDPQVFNVLEESIMQIVMESQAASAKNAQGVSETGQPNAGKKASPDQERIDRINGLVQDNKIEAAYAEFKRVEKQLKNAMPKDDFKLLKSMVEDSYKTFKKNNK